MARPMVRAALSIAVLLVVVSFLLVVVDQPVYQIGLRFTLQERGFLVQRVVDGSVAEKSGLVPGTILAELNGFDAVSLYEQSIDDPASFLAVAGTVFGRDRVVSARDNDGREFTFREAPMSWPMRLSLVPPTTRVNIIVAVLLSLVGIVFSGWVGEERPARAFVVFVESAAVAVALSYFHSYWSPAVLVARFVVLDIAGTVAGASLVVFGLRFPIRRTLSLAKVVVGLCVPMATKYLLVLLGVVRLLGMTHLVIHGYLVVTIGLYVATVILGFRQGDQGERRRLKWITLGAFTSVLPYLGYMLSVLLRARFVFPGGADYLGLFAGVALILFPVSMGIAILRSTVIDVDVLLRNVVVFVVGVAGWFLVALTLARLLGVYAPAVSLVPLVLPLALLSPLLAEGSRRIGSLVASRRARDAGQETLRLSRGLVGVTDPDELRLLLHRFFTEVYHASYLLFFEDLTDPDSTPLVLPQGELPHDDATQHLRESLESAPTTDVLVRDGRLGIAVSAARRPRAAIIVGPRTDGDQYIKSDVDTIRSLVPGIAQALDAGDIYDELRRTIDELEVRVVEREQMVRRLSESDRRIRASLREKEHLIREVHHRVKNNMQLMRSLLSLQADIADDPRLSELLGDSRDRINSMALVHETLYQTGRFADVDLRGYLGGLIDNLVKMHAAGATPVRTETEIADIFVPAQFAVPLGLITNELVTNAYKHAFAGRSSGTISFEVRVLRATDTDPTPSLASPAVDGAGEASEAGRHSDAVDYIDISITDDGVPYRSGSWESSTGLGHTLVATLTQQIGGRVIIRDDDEKRISIRAPRPKEAATTDASGNVDLRPTQ